MKRKKGAHSESAIFDGVGIGKNQKGWDIEVPEKMAGMGQRLADARAVRDDIVFLRWAKTRTTRVIQFERI